MARLFQIVASNHDVTEEQIRWHLAHRPTELDIAVILTFIVLYGWAAIVVVRRVCRRNADHQETSGWIAMMVYTSIITSVVGVLLGEVWSDLIENVRLGNGHLSYRAERIPWSHHRLGFFVGGVVLFWLLATLHHRGRSAALGVWWTSAR